MAQKAENPPPKVINDFVTLLRNVKLANKILKLDKVLKWKDKYRFSGSVFLTFQASS